MELNHVRSWWRLHRRSWLLAWCLHQVKHLRWLLSRWLSLRWLLLCHSKHIELGLLILLGDLRWRRIRIWKLWFRKVLLRWLLLDNQGTWSNMTWWLKQLLRELIRDLNSFLWSAHKVHDHEELTLCKSIVPILVDKSPNFSANLLWLLGLLHDLLHLIIWDCAWLISIEMLENLFITFNVLRTDVEWALLLQWWGITLLRSLIHFVDIQVI